VDTVTVPFAVRGSRGTIECIRQHHIGDIEGPAEDWIVTIRTTWVMSGNSHGPGSVATSLSASMEQSTQLDRAGVPVSIEAVGTTLTTSTEFSWNPYWGRAVVNDLTVEGRVETKIRRVR
jgi:hypothetical protein